MPPRCRTLTYSDTFCGTLACNSAAARPPSLGVLIERTAKAVLAQSPTARYTSGGSSVDRTGAVHLASALWRRTPVLRSDPPRRTCPESPANETPLFGSNSSPDSRAATDGYSEAEPKSRKIVGA